MTENIWIAFSYDFWHWFNYREVIKVRLGYWDDAKVGAAGPLLNLKIAGF